MPDFTHVQPQFNVLLDVSCALVPFLLSLVLFRADRDRTGWWWGGLCAWFAFLPTAPYTLTDIIHLIAAIRYQPPFSLRSLILAWFPFFTAYMLLCFQAYVISLILWDQYLRRQHRAHWLLPSELILSFLSAIGIYLGRVQRLSSWDLLIRPLDVLRALWQDFSLHEFAGFVIVTTIVIVGLYFGLKLVDIALWQTYLAPDNKLAVAPSYGKRVGSVLFPTLGEKFDQGG